jgi:hypothetical protein
MSKKLDPEKLARLKELASKRLGEIYERRLREELDRRKDWNGRDPLYPSPVIDPEDWPPNVVSLKGRAARKKI